MAVFSFNDFNKFSESKTNNFSSSPRVEYFRLKNDGDEAIVRFPYESVSELEIHSVHKVKNGEYWSSVECLRKNKNDLLCNCPLCNNGGEAPKYRIFVKMIQYFVDENGNVTYKPVIWERPWKFSTQLNSYIQEYGSLKNSVFKIKRHGKAGDTNTSYDIIPANPNTYREDVFIPDFTGFDGYNVLGRVVLNKSFEELEQFVKTGTFTNTTKESETTNTTQVNKVEQKQYTETPQEFARPRDFVSHNVETTTQVQTTQQVQGFRPTRPERVKF